MRQRRIIAPGPDAMIRSGNVSYQGGSGADITQVNDRGISYLDLAIWIITD
jgi:hypothetical protein